LGVYQAAICVSSVYFVRRFNDFIDSFDSIYFAGFIGYFIF